MGLKHANVELHVDQLVLYDVASAQRQRVAAAIEQALTQMLAEQGAAHEWSTETFTINVSVIQIRSGTKPEAIGAQVAQSVYRQIVGSQSPADSIDGTY